MGPPWGKAAADPTSSVEILSSGAILQGPCCRNAELSSALNKLLALPAAMQLPGDRVQMLLEAAVNSAAWPVVACLCTLPAARQLGPATVCVLLLQLLQAPQYVGGAAVGQHQPQDQQQGVDEEWKARAVSSLLGMPHAASIQLLEVQQLLQAASDQELPQLMEWAWQHVPSAAAALLGQR